MHRPLRVLLFSTLYPSSVLPSHGIFVQTRLRHLLASGAVDVRVVAPVPWFPSRHPRFGEYANFAATPLREERFGIDVRHPRFVRLPRIGMTSAPLTLAACGVAAARQVQAEGFDFDLIDAHYFYPDGVAATIMGKVLGKPVTITARGTDINLIPQHHLPRLMILRAAAASGHMITVCRALKDAMVELGAAEQKITVLRNGVDLQLFRPEARDAARARLGPGGFHLASVGHLIERKGHHHAIDALPALPDAVLHVAGSGPEDTALRARARALGVADRVHFLGGVSQDALRSLYNGVDALVLASSREGWANVLLEAMACGTPVVASDVWGTPEVVAMPEAGVLMQSLDGAGVAEAVQRLRGAMPQRAETRRYAEGFDWDETTRGQLEIFRRLTGKHLLGAPAHA
jgi:glycosyltransferase involved in cell wall biosynthesis